MTTQTQPTITAESRYHDERQETDLLLKAIARRVTDHAQRAHQYGPTKDWGYVGDLEHINQQLERVLDFLKGEE